MAVIYSWLVAIGSQIFVWMKIKMWEFRWLAFRCGWIFIFYFCILYLFSLESYLIRLHYWNTAFFNNYSTGKIFDQYLIKIYFNVDIINERIFNLNCITKISLYPALSLDISNCDITSFQRNLILNSPEFNKINQEIVL